MSTLSRYSLLPSIIRGMVGARPCYSSRIDPLSGLVRSTEYSRSWEIGEDSGKHIIDLNSGRRLGLCFVLMPCWLSIVGDQYGRLRVRLSRAETAPLSYQAT